MRKAIYSALAGLSTAMLASTAIAQTNVGASTNNTTVATGVGTVFFYDVNNGVLTNSSKIIGLGNQQSTIVATGVNSSTLINSNQVRADGSNSIAVNSVKTIQNSGQIRSLSGTAIHMASGVSSITNEAGGKISSGGSHAIKVATGVSSITNHGLIETSAAGATTIDGATIIQNTGTIRSLSGSAVKMGSSGGSVTNEAGGNIIAQGTNGIAVDSASITDNSGTIYSAAGTAIRMGIDNSSVTNHTSGKITSNGSHAIKVAPGISGTNITNHGLVEARGTNGIGIDSASIIQNSGIIRSLSGTAVKVASGVNSITNEVNGKISSGGSHAIHVASGVGNTSITNDGLIESSGANGTAVDGAKTIQNTGTIRSLSGTAVNMASEGSSITNEAGGHIISFGSHAIKAATGVSNTNLINHGYVRVTGTNGTAVDSVKTIQNTGTLRSNTGTAVRIGVNDSTVTNESNGKIASGGAYAIQVASGANNATIINHGLIEATAANGTAIDGAHTIQNTGTIRSLNGDAIHVASATSTITNEATGLIAGDTTAIDNSLHGAALTIHNAGDIRGDILFGTGANTLNVTGGKIIGDIVGQSANDTVNFSASAFRTRGLINNIGNINVNSGLLVLDHAINGNTHMVIAAGSRVKANHSTIDSNSVTNSGILEITANNNPTITGDYLQNQSGRLRVHVDSDSNGTLGVTGTATLVNGASVDAMFEQGMNVPNGATYTVVDSGTLTADPNQLNITSNNAFVSLSASAVNDDLILTAATAQPAQALSNVLSNANIASTSQLQTLAGGSNAGSNTVQSLNSFTGLMSNLQATNNAEFERINAQFGHLNGIATVQALNDVAPDAATIGGSIASVFNSTNSGNNIVAERLHHIREVQLAGGSFHHAFTPKQFGDDVQVWAQPFLTGVNRGIQNGVSGFDANSYGLLMGADIGITPQARLGASLGYSETEVTLRSNGIDGSDIDSYQANLYGTYLLDEDFYIDAMLGLGFNDYETTESVGFLGTQTHADYKGMQYNARIGAGYDINTNAGFVITPNAFVQYTHLAQDAYTTTGSGVNRRTAKMDTDSLITSAGVKVAYPYHFESGDRIAPFIRGSYLYEGGDDEQTVTSTFVDGGGSFTTTSPAMERDALHLGGGVDFHSTSNMRIGTNLDYISRDEQNTLSGALRVRIPF